MKNPNCYMPACGIEGKRCPDCANYRPPKSELYFAVKDFFIGSNEYKSNDVWFTKTNGDLYMFDRKSVEIPESYLRVCKNPSFPTASVLTFRLDAEYPGSPAKNTLFIMRKEKDVFTSNFWRGGWRSDFLKNVDLRDWKNHFTQINSLTIKG